ncbi:3-deoxy-D-manno-octulosonate 8-phosphate phosphatase [Acidobacteria bacterium Mor1]|nr:3-deoxy-D-manno-octulosonate 8-phosphate phosphatase [Acidobacteria bacterium Mor1]
MIERARRIRFVLLDNDGVLTDGRLYQSAGGIDARAFHTHDGHGIRMGQAAGLEFGIISGRESAIVRERAEELDFNEVHLGILRKGKCLDEILERRGFDDSELCFVGDDLIDLPVLRRAGLSVAPQNARPEVKEQVHWVTPNAGGDGAVRDLIDLLLRSSGKWDEITERYFS